MDTTWFAVDRDGHVAAFETGEAGAVPTAAYLGEDHGEVTDALLAAGGGPDARDDDDDDDPLARLGDAGVFVYRHDDQHVVAGPYRREVAPERPLPGHQVPRALLAKMASFDGRFADTEALQPAELWPSEGWSSAYVTLDGTTVRCLPGHEADYAAELAELQDALAGEYVIEPAAVAAPPAPLPPARAEVRRPWWQFWKRR